MSERLRTLPSHRRLIWLIRGINLVLVVALLTFGLRGVWAPDPEHLHAVTGTR